MALPNSVPTSFVPHPSVNAARGFKPDVYALFSYVAFGILGIVFILALGVFLYSRVLTSQHAAKGAELAKLAEGLDVQQVKGFIRLRDRLDTTERLVKKHVAVAEFFTALEAMTLTTVRFNNLRLTVDGPTNARFEAAGVAKSFNSLAVASAQMGSDPRLSGVIFSNITKGKDGTVSFTLTGAIDPSLTTYKP